MAGSIVVEAEQLRLHPLPPSAAAALPADRQTAAREIGAELDAEWPQPDLLDLLPGQADLSDEQAMWGIWVIADRDSGQVVGDIGFHAPPSADGSVEIGFSIVPSRRRRGYASRAAGALIGWACRQPKVSVVVARCDPDNEASVRTLRRAGLAQVGTDGEMLRWRMAC